MLSISSKKTVRPTKKSPEMVVTKKWETQRMREEKRQAIQNISKDIEALEKTRLPWSTAFGPDRPRSFVISGDGWTYEVRIMPGGWHSGGGGRRPHPITYQVGSSLSGNGRAVYKWRSNLTRKKGKKKERGKE
jgi:hypothetical protein